ncbi:MAG TPA: alkaline phosphatase family protein [Verrucomicrobiae bacterium]|nr:alkaline phosphatase family protein [Verrucomicrobiae bacterium]
MFLLICRKSAFNAVTLLSGLLLTAPFAQAATGPGARSISPSSGTADGGTVVTISGTNFQSGATATVGGVALTNLTVTGDSIKGTTAAHLAGGADVVVTNPDGQHAMLRAMMHNQGFEAGSSDWLFSGQGSASVVSNVNNAHNGTYYAELSSPKAGDQPAFFAASGGSSKYFPVAAGDVVTFGGWAYRVSGDGRARWTLEVTDSQQKNATYIAAAPGNVGSEEWDLQQSSYTVPSGKAFVRLYCEITLNTVAAVARFDDAVLKISPGGGYGYTFVSPPILTRITPNWGAPAGGTSRTAIGTGFATGDKISLGGNAGSDVIVNGANAITFFAPSGAAGTVAATVTSSDGQSSKVASAYTYKTPPAPPSGMTKIHHIVFEIQENRSFDDYFGVMNQYRANNGVNDNAVDDLNLNTSLPDIAGQMIKPFHMQTECMENTQPSWDASHADYDNGKMDGFMKTGNNFAESSIIDPNGTRAMGYFDWTDLPYYYALAFDFATSDRWFSPVMGPTGANRAYTFAATSLGWVSTPQPPNGGLPNFTIFDLLDQAGISWKYYYQNSHPTWIPEWSVYTRDQSKIVPLNPNYYDDVADESTFPQVVFIEENGDKDEHPKPDPGTSGATENIQSGAELLSNIIGGLMGSPSWQSSVFILTWDEAGGIHDHTVPPAMAAPDGYTPKTNPAVDQPGVFNQAGFRVPLIVISPWTGPHQVSHTVRDHTSILKLIETRFSLPPLTARDAAADNMSEFFNFSSPPWMTPPTLPTQPTSGTCDLNLETAPGS